MAVLVFVVRVAVHRIAVLVMVVVVIVVGVRVIVRVCRPVRVFVVVFVTVFRFHRPSAYQSAPSPTVMYRIGPMPHKSATSAQTIFFAPSRSSRPIKLRNINNMAIGWRMIQNKIWMTSLTVYAPLVRPHPAGA